MSGLSKYYHIDYIYDDINSTVLESNIENNIINYDDFEKINEQYDRIIYNFTNSLACAYMRDAIYKYPGVVILHDFFLSKAIEEVNKLKISIYNEGYMVFANKYNHAHQNQNLEQSYNFDVVDNSRGVIAYEENLSDLAKKYYGNKTEFNIISQFGNNCTNELYNAIEKFYSSKIAYDVARNILTTYNILKENISDISNQINKHFPSNSCRKNYILMSLTSPY